MSTLVLDTLQDRVSSTQVTMTKLLNPWELQEEWNFSTAVAEIDFENGFEDNYDHQFVYAGVAPDIADTFSFRVKEGGVYVANTGGYRYGKVSHISTTHSAGASQIQYGVVGTVGTADPAEQCSGYILFMNAGESTYRTSTIGLGISASASGITDMKIGMSGNEREFAASCEGVRFFWTSGNDFADGRISHYRRKTS